MLDKRENRLKYLPRGYFRAETRGDASEMDRRSFIETSPEISTPFPSGSADLRVVVLAQGLKIAGLVAAAGRPHRDSPWISLATRARKGRVLPGHGDAKAFLGGSGIAIAIGDPSSTGRNAKKLADLFGESIWPWVFFPTSWRKQGSNSSPCTMKARFPPLLSH
jgi:hypothetical protein